MPWGDKAVSPVVYTPIAADASGWALDTGLEIIDGRIGFETFTRNGLLALYKWEDFSVNSGNGTWLDASGNGNTATSTGAQTPSTSALGVVFNGIANVMRTSTRAELKAENFTVMMVSDFSPSGTHMPFAISNSNRDEGVGGYFHTGVSIDRLGSSPNYRRWSHSTSPSGKHAITLVMGNAYNDNAFLRDDGILIAMTTNEGSYSGSIQNVNRQFILGCFLWAADRNFYKGTVYAVAIWNRKLSENEIKQAHNYFNSLYSLGIW